MKDKKSTIYTISKREIDRRIMAYTTLIISFFLSSIVFAFNYITDHLSISLFIILIAAIILITTRDITIKYFNSIHKNKLTLTKEYLERNEHKYLIKDIKQINIKRTSPGYLREIKIMFNDKNIIYINGINDFEEFANELQNYLLSNTLITKSREPIDFDHPTFYFFFGILVSFISINFAKFIITLNINQLHIFNYTSSLSSIILGLYFIIYKPIYKRDEKKQQKTDYIWGILFITSGLLILLPYVF